MGAPAAVRQLSAHGKGLAAAAMLCALLLVLRPWDTGFRIRAGPAAAISLAEHPADGGGSQAGAGAAAQPAGLPGRLRGLPRAALEQQLVADAKRMGDLEALYEAEHGRRREVRC